MPGLPPSGTVYLTAADASGKWTGLDVDFCRAIAAATVGDGTKVRFVPLNAQQRFTALQSGEIDILSRNTTWTLTRDASLGLHFTGVTYYDGQGFMVPKKLNVKSAKQLKGATVCVQSGTTTEKNLTDFSRANNLNIKPVVFEKVEAATGAYFAGRCQAYTTDASGLASVRNKEAKDPAEHLILPELISKEPLGPSVRRGDDEFFAIVKWVGFALLEGLTRWMKDVVSTDPNGNRRRAKVIAASATVSEPERQLEHLYQVIALETVLRLGIVQRLHRRHTQRTQHQGMRNQRRRGQGAALFDNIEQLPDIARPTGRG